MKLEDLLATAEEINASVDQQGGRVSLETSAVSRSAATKFAELAGELASHDFWTAAVSQQKYLPDNGLWAPQRRAIGLCLAYMATRRTKEAHEGAALVKMPTGTGKTGVIATLACALPSIKRTLVITPRRALVDQMIVDLHTRQWGRFDLIYSGTDVRRRKADDPVAGAKVLGGPVSRLLPGDAPALSSLATERMVMVGTFAALEQILRPDRPAHRLSGRRPAGADEIPPDSDDTVDLKDADRKKLVELLRSFDLVIVDESHYEPAFIWSQCIRSLGRPTVLFSATPYRNDFRYFDIDGRFAFNLSFQEATDRKLIRGVRVLADDAGAPPNETYAQRLVRFAKQVGKSTSPDQPDRARIIVRGESYESLVELRHQLGAIGKPSVLIHHKEKRNATELRFQSVTDALSEAGTEHVQFWLHQWKLLEGVDDSRFGGVAVSEAFSTSRAVVQQVGRVLRFSDRTREETALVMGWTDLGVDLADRFARYQNYEKRFNEDPGEALRRETQFFETLRAASPAVQYISGDFRDRFDLDDEQASFMDIQLPSRAYVMNNVGGRTLDEITEASKLAMGLEDRHDATILRPIGDADPSDLRLIVYVAWGNSPLLTRRAMPTWNLGVMALGQIGSRIFLLDTEGLVIDPQLLGLEAESPGNMQRLVPTPGLGEVSRVTVASSISLDISDTGVRSATARMRDFSEGFYDLAQGMQATTSVRASIRKQDDQPTALRYLSLARSSVSDGSGKYFAVSEYATWLGEIAKQLNATAPAPSKTFERFAQAVPAPSISKATPLNVLFDFVDMLGDAGEDAPTQWDDTKVAGLISADKCLDVDTTGSFSLVVDGRPFAGTLKYEITGTIHRRGRYVVECDDLDSYLIGHKAKRKEKPRLLSGMLTRDQAFRVIPDDPTLIYAQRHFYHPRQSIKEIAKDLPGGPLEYVTGSTWLASMKSEKGSGTWPMAQWVSESVFGGVYAQEGLADFGAANTTHQKAIRNLDPEMADRLAKFSFIICDDGGTEACDFLCVDESAADPRLVLIHAKVDDTAMSLNSMQAVGRQAQASLAFLTRIEALPDRTAEWRSKVNIKDGKIASRIVKGTGSVKTLWERARDAAKSVNYRKEIWILAGNILERGLLLSELKKPDPSPRVRQMIYYLATLQTSTNRANVGMRIFCSP